MIVHVNNHCYAVIEPTGIGECVSLTCLDTRGGRSRPKYYKNLEEAVSALDGIRKPLHSATTYKVGGFLAWCIIGAGVATLVLGLSSLPVWVLVAAWIISRL